HAGRIYLAKDAVSRGEQVRAMYPRLEEWLELKARIDPQWHFRSHLSQRLGWHHE
ncbi:MAG: FAD-binding oxidoreductase, partial [Gammaproteobacteria bacterium]